MEVSLQMRQFIKEELQVMVVDFLSLIDLLGLSG
jgi:hypothetical protein